MRKKLERAPDDIRQSAEKEYYFLQAEVGRFDQIAISVKNWSITIGVALFTAAFYKNLPLLFLMSALSSLLFWMTEARWKRYQMIHMERIREVEEYLIGDRKDYKGPAIRKSFRERLGLCASEGPAENKSFEERLGSYASARRDEIGISLLGNVRLPHMPMIVLGVGLYCLSAFGIIATTQAEQNRTPFLGTRITELEMVQDFSIASVNLKPVR